VKDKFSIEDWNKEYQYLLDSRRISPPAHLTSSLKKSFHDDLNPAVWAVFGKLFAIHFISGAITLFFCPQLGVNLHGKDGMLLDLFRGFGEYGCNLACGALFLGGTGLIAALLLRSQEIRAIKRTRALQWAFLAFLSLGLFLSIREEETAISFGLVTAWLLGALSGGFFTFQIGSFVRQRVKHYLLS